MEVIDDCLVLFQASFPSPHTSFLNSKKKKQMDFREFKKNLKLQFDEHNAACHELS
jgi:hypothetical protein